MPELQSLSPALIKATGVRAKDMKPRKWACAALRVPRNQPEIALPLLAELNSTS